jgi:hypothetical protein
MKIDDVIADAERRMTRPDDVEVVIAPPATGWRRLVEWPFEKALEWLIGEPIRPSSSRF